MKNTRQSNFELLRILSMFLIVCFHYALKGTWPTDLRASAQIARNVFLIFGELGVNLFMMISGYFLISGTRKWKNVAGIVAKSVFYTIIAGIFLLKIGEFPYAGKGMLVMVMPEIFNVYWFVTVYLLIYLFVPYLNLLLQTMEKKQMRECLGLALLLWSVLPTGYQFYFGNTETGLYYSRFVWLLILYGIGGYIRRFGLINDRKKAGIGALAVFAGMLLLTAIPVLYPGIPLIRILGSREFWPPNSVTMVLLSVCVFEFFRHLHIGCIPAVNTAAKTTLGIYMIHDGLAGMVLWRRIGELTAMWHMPVGLQILLVSALVFCAAMILDLARSRLCAAVFPWFGR